MAAAGDLTTLDAVKMLIGIDTGTTASDPLLQSLITEISAFVPQVIQRGVLTTTYVETRRGNGKAQFQLRNFPVQSINKVEWAGQQITTSLDLFDTGNGAATDGRSLILRGYTMPYNQPVRITYVAGWDQCPADIAGAVTELVAEAYSRKSHTGETSHSSSGATTVSFDRSAMHAAIAAKLDQYIPGAPLC